MALHPLFPDRIRIWSVDFCGGKKTGEPGEKPPEQARDENEQQGMGKTCPSTQMLIIDVNGAYANVTLAFERCCVTKMRFTRVCMGTSRICFKFLKFNAL